MQNALCNALKSLSATTGDHSSMFGNTRFVFYNAIQEANVSLLSNHPRNSSAV